jgi:hypothetical protein
MQKERDFPLGTGRPPMSSAACDWITIRQLHLQLFDKHSHGRKGSESQTCLGMEITGTLAAFKLCYGAYAHLRASLRTPTTALYNST